MDPHRYLERWLTWLKAMERRFYLSDYEDLRFRTLGIGADSEGLYEERLYQPVPTRESVRSVLIFKPDDLGDTLLALPAHLANLQSKHLNQLGYQGNHLLLDLQDRPCACRGDGWWSWSDWWSWSGVALGDYRHKEHCVSSSWSWVNRDGVGCTCHSVLSCGH